MDPLNFAFFAKKKPTSQALAGLQSQVNALLSGAGIFEGTVEKHADLPDPAAHASRIWVVKTATGIPLVNKKESGLYLSDGVTWTYLDSSNAELAKYTVGSDSLVTSNLLLEGIGVGVTLDKASSKIIFALPNTNLPNGALILDSTGKVPDTYLYGYSMKPQGDISSPADRLTLGGGNLPVGTLLKVVNSVEGENGTSYLLMSAPSSNPDNWIVFTGTNFPVTMVYGRSGEIVAEKGDYTDSLITLASQVDVHIAGTELSTVLADLFTKMDGKATKTLSNVSSEDLINAIKGAGFGITDVAGLAIALSEKEPLLQASTTSKYYRGDKSWQTLDKAAVGLGNVDNTSDANKPVSTAQATAIALKEDAANKTAGTLETNKTSDVKFPTVKAVYDWATGLLSEKQDTLVSGTSIKTINGNTVLGSGDLVIAGGGGGTTTNSLTAGTGLSGGSFNGSTPVTFALADGYGDTKNPYASKTAKQFLCAPNAANGPPVFRAIVNSDLPSAALAVKQFGSGSGINEVTDIPSSATEIKIVVSEMSVTSGTISLLVANSAGTYLTSGFYGRVNYVSYGWTYSNKSSIQIARSGDLTNLWSFDLVVTLTKINDTKWAWSFNGIGGVTNNASAGGLALVGAGIINVTALASISKLKISAPSGFDSDGTSLAAMGYMAVFVR